MYLTKSTLAEIREQGSDFISLKFLDINGKLQQIDTLLYRFNEVELLINEDIISLEPFFAMKDPFRSAPTTSVFCNNINNSLDYRDKLKLQWTEFLQGDPKEEVVTINLWQSFFVKPLEIDGGNNYMFVADPIDKLADMRSEIFSLLDEINIDVTFHFHGESKNESVIGVKDANLVSLADKLVILRYVIRNVAISYGYEVNFMQNELINLKLDLNSDKINIKQKIIKLIENKDSIISRCVELKSIWQKKNKENVQSNLGKGQISAEQISAKFITENDFNPYLLFLDLIIDKK